MGRPMAAQPVLGRGCAVRAWNRSAEKAEPLRDEGAEVLRERRGGRVGSADIVLTMLADTDAVLESARQALASAGPAGFCGCR